MKKNSQLVYSTETGRVKAAPDSPQREPSDGIIRISRETKGRKGKGVTLIKGFDLDESALKTLAKTLKQLCGTGGTAKDGIIEIQGDQREKLKLHLESQGHTVKLSGG